ncbi:major capsid protein [Daphnia sinensis]|uniref:Major capsid protein n=1 Tax=Daphnia sinensis TaxID=1820382 RepID=A0AAD5PLI4_9CRUS|nr:major capsid protein [Daphnia sinensis]
MSSSAIVQLVSKGVQDSVLTYKPTKTLFRSKYSQISNFAIEFFRVNFQTPLDYGSTGCNCEIARSGDLIKDMWVRFKVNALKRGGGADNLPYSAHFVNMLPFALFSRIELNIGTYRIDQHSGRLLAILEDIETVPGKSLGIAVGKASHTSQLREWANHDMEYFFPLQFWFNRRYGAALPIVALQFHTVRIDIDTRPMRDLVRDCGGIAPTATDKYGGAISESNMIVEYIFVDEQERALWAQAQRHDYLIDLWQEKSFSVAMANTSGQDQTINQQLNFGFPVKELLIVCQPRRRNNDPGNNDFFNFSSPGKNGSNPLYLPITSIDVRYNNTGMQYSYSGLFSHKVLMPKYHTRTPNLKSFIVPYALQPEDSIQPTGSTNFSRIDTIDLNLRMHESMTAWWTSGCTLGV